MVAHRPTYGKHEAPKISYVDKQPVNERHTFEEDLHREHPHDGEHYYQRHYMEHSNDYHELETPHSLEPFKSKSILDPTVHFHDYHDFPPEFYKAEYYGNYHKLSEDMMSPEQYY